MGEAFIDVALAGRPNFAWKPMLFLWICGLDPTVPFLLLIPLSRLSRAVRHSPQPPYQLQAGLISIRLAIHYISLSFFAAFHIVSVAALGMLHIHENIPRNKCSIICKLSVSWKIDYTAVHKNVCTRNAICNVDMSDSQFVDMGLQLPIFSLHWNLALVIEPNQKAS